MLDTKCVHQHREHSVVSCESSIVCVRACGVPTDAKLVCARVRVLVRALCVRAQRMIVRINLLPFAAGASEPGVARAIRRSDVVHN